MRLILVKGVDMGGPDDKGRGEVIEGPSVPMLRSCSEGYRSRGGP